MTSETNSGGWDRVTAELRACREAQQRAWGDLDNTTLGRYLAGEANTEEQQQIEIALDELPELRKLTELVRDVLGESEAAVPAPVAKPVPHGPAILPFAQPRTAVPPGADRPWPRDARFRQRAGLIAAAGLLLILGFALPGPGGVPAPAGTPLAMSQPVAFHVSAFGPDEHFLAMGIEAKEPAPRMMTAARAADPPREEQDWLNRIDASVRALEAKGKKHEAKMLARQYASNRTRQAMFYQEKGDLARAEPAFHQARVLCKNALGAQAPETIRTRNSLAGVYEIALNAAPPPPQANTLNGSANRYGVSGGQRGHHSPRVQHATAIALRERITRQSQQELKTSVVPVLTQALRQASDIGERRRLARALGQLGPAAREAVPLLIDRCRDTTDVSERTAMLLALGQIGPVAREAVPVLLSSLHSGNPEVRACAARALVQLGSAARHCCQDLATEGAHDSLCREVAQRLNGPEGCSGVEDECDCFSVKALQRARSEVRRLAKTYRIEVRIETVPGQIVAVADKVEDRKSNFGEPCIYLGIAKDAPVVQVYVSESLRQQGLTDAELRRVLEPHLQKKDFDRGLQASVEFLAAFERKQGRK